MRKMLCYMALALCVLAVLACFAPALADFGDFDTGGDYSGDYDGYDSGSGGSGGSVVWAVLGLLFMPILMVYEGLTKKDKDKGVSSGGSVNTSRPNLHRKSMAELVKADPNFDGQDLDVWVKNLYTRMQAEWEQGDIRGLKEDFTPECWNRFDQQLRVKNADGYQGHVRDIRFVRIVKEGWYRTGYMECIDVNLRTSIISWNTNRNGKITTGSQTTPKDMEYTWRLKRIAGAQTDPTPSPCPGCGAQVKRIMSRCPDCDTELRRDPDAWKLDDITGRRM